jgi:glycosyltransferase involved in cell wall biosynthesis
MRVLHVTSLAWDEREGVARSVMGVATMLSEHEHHLAADRPSGAPFAGLHEVPGWGPTRPWRRSFADVLDAVQPDLVHLHGGSLITSLAFAPSLAGTPCVASLYHLLQLPPLTRHPLTTVRESRRSRVGPLRLLVSVSAGGTLVDRALRTGRISALLSQDPAAVRRFDAGDGLVHFAPGGVRSVRRSARWRPDPVIAFAGKAEAGRGVDDLIAAFRLVRASVPRAQLVLNLLPGPELGRWARLAGGEQGVEVRTGGGDLEPHLAEATVVALPFRFNLTITPPLVAVEAMALGVPVIATASAGAHAVLRDGLNGAVVPERDPAALAATILDVVRAQDRWRELSEHAAATIEQTWTWQHARCGVLGAYRRAVGSGFTDVVSTPRAVAVDLSGTAGTDDEGMVLS